MDRVEVSTVVYLPAEDVYEFLLAFRRYANYSQYLESVRQFGDGGAGTEYALRFEWWKLHYTARSAVTGVDPPRRIDWRIIKDIDASGRWLIDPIEGAEGSVKQDAGGSSEEDTGGSAEGDADRSSPKTEVTFIAEYAPGSADDGIVDLPRFVSLGWVVEKIKPKIREEAERIVRRVVADLEGEERDVELRIETA
ncbi:MAG: putative membrane protein [Natronomonas sp.]|uniref:SRPBCC family protein n=1 Tax=Natronomonas sp. TaxID=2184060 RepID=UPI003989D1E6